MVIESLFQNILELRKLLKLKLRILDLIKRDAENSNIELNKTLNLINDLEYKLRREVRLFNESRRAFATKEYVRLISNLKEEINLLREEHNKTKIAYINYKNLSNRIRRIQRLLKKFEYINILQGKKLSMR